MREKGKDARVTQEATAKMGNKTQQGWTKAKEINRQIIRKAN